MTSAGYRVDAEKNIVDAISIIHTVVTSIWMVLILVRFFVSWGFVPVVSEHVMSTMLL